MAPNLHLWLLACAALTAAGAGGPPVPCPPEAGRLVAAGWRAYRADSISLAARRFDRADRMCEGNLDAKVGLAYTLLRRNRLASAESLFTLVTDQDQANGDGWDGLAAVRWRRSDQAGALAAARRAIALHPDNAGTREILDRLAPDWDRPALGPPERPPTLRVDARTQRDYFQIPDPSAPDGWRWFYVKGVNLGVALPGKFPTEFPLDSAVYAGWLDTIAAMHANTVRVYTILPPAFYRALAAWNRGHPDRILWLIHGVWTELPPEHDFDDSAWKGEVREEMRRVVDLLHGHASFPARPGHAGGRYDADVSAWTLAYIIGREWEPFAVKEFERRHPEHAPYSGRFLASRGPVGAMDAWMAEQCDYLLGYEVDSYNSLRPIAYTNWPTLDPLHHVTEATGEEEQAWREKAGRPIPGGIHEYENDVVELDAGLVEPTPANPAGWFASYHAYPYYPDFMLYDPGYDTARSSEGRSSYFGYLSDLKRHHAGMPLLIAEYGVPSSRGLAHLQPQGWNHGGHDEREMASIDARLTREIRESGAAGGVLFAWLDEWFKKNWVVVDYEIPQENTRQWHNVMDAEQNYGVLGMYAGEKAATPRLGGERSRWRALFPVAPTVRDTAGGPRSLRIGSDASYVYLAVELRGAGGRPFPWGKQDVLIALDTWRADLGQHLLPDSVVRSEVGFEFVAIFRDTSDAELRVTPDYNRYVGAEAIADGDDRGQFARRPITTVSRDDGRFDSLFVIINRARFTRDGRFIPARGYNRGRLRYGTEAGSTLSDWYWDREAGLLEVRLPWDLLNVSDPSTRTLLYDTRTRGPIGTRPSDGFRVGVLVTGKGSSAKGESLIGALPAARNGRWRAASFVTWRWPGWTMPRYHQRLKPVYDSLKAAWGDR